jgi:nicotinamide mononucleotide transporter
VKLENWLYWIAADSVSIYLFGAQRLPFVALLFAAYLVVSVVGYWTWRRTLHKSKGQSIVSS